jgi:alpha-tubulin suppressor-like RCC1 family protein
VFCWGSNNYGQLGIGNNLNTITPTVVSGLGNGVIAITAGQLHTCAITASRSIFCWGGNEDGQLGGGAGIYSNTPIPVQTVGSAIRAIYPGYRHTCAIPMEGGALCWGNNDAGQIGNGTTVDTTIPTPVTEMGSDVQSVALGEQHTCATTTSGALKCWGISQRGRLGNQEIADNYTSPVSVTGLVRGVQALSKGGSHNCVLTHVGAALCWGWNIFGAVGNGTTGNVRTPVQVAGLSSGVTDISASWFHTCAVTSDGAALCWGRNDTGQLGNGTFINTSLPVSVSNLLSGVRTIDAGVIHTCAATDQGAAWCWGFNSSGQLGDGTNSSSHTPVAVRGLSSGVQDIEAGHSHSCAISEVGAALCWGHNFYGQLGQGNFVDANTPLTVTNLMSGVAAIKLGGSHTCALTLSGAVWCWGANNYGQLGNGTLVRSNVPVPVSNLTSGVVSLSVGNNHACALILVGKVFCWGHNLFGQLGTLSVENANVPLEVTGFNSEVIAISAGSEHTCVRTASLTVQCWGRNDSGQLGNGTAWYETPQNVYGFAAPEPPPTGDRYEDDDTCDKATDLIAGIATQTHSFDKLGDADWIRIELVTGTNYSLVANNLSNRALPNFTLRTSCVTPPVAVSPPSFGGEVRLPMNASDYPPGTYYVKITNTPSTTFGLNVSYTLSFRNTSSVGAAIIVAGKNGGEIFQNVITQSTDLAYITLLRNGFGKENIWYLDNHLSRDVDGNGIADDVDEPATVANVKNAITHWAQSRTGPARPLWLYLADHGYADQFLVSGNGPGDIITPSDLNHWLNQLEATTGVDQINVIIDACYAGSFITPETGSISKRGRAILASTRDDRIASGKPAAPNFIQRLYFSEALWSSLDANLSLKDAFDTAKQASARATAQDQIAWLDDNGDGNPNTAQDGLVSETRGLIGSTTTGGRPFLSWTLVNTTTGALIVSAQAANGASSVIVEVAKPNSSQTIIPGQISLTPHDYVPLVAVGNGQWIGSYSGFSTPGIYRLLAYGFDSDGSPALPVEITVQVGATLIATPTQTPTVTPIASITTTSTATSQATVPTLSPVPPTTLTPTPTHTPLPGALPFRAFLPIAIKQ